MPDDIVFITGLEDVRKSLDDLPAQIVRELFQDALAAGGAVIEQELVRRTPRADTVTTSAKKYGRLIDDIATTVEVDPKSLTGSARTGFSDDGFVARMVEYGHTQISDGKVTGSTPAHPFMRPAADAAEDAAVEAFTESLGEKIR